MKLVLDAMGGDSAPAETVAGAVDFARDSGHTIFLAGREAAIRAELAKHDTTGLNLPIVDAPDVISMEEKPAMAVRRKRNNSMVVGMKLVREGEADAFCSVGNTGAILTAGHMVFRRIRGVQRAALATPFPNNKGFHILGDVGANTDCRPEWLVQWGHLLAIYAGARLNIQNPSVALLSNGEEEGKGNDLVRATQTLMAREKGLNYIGVVEPKDMLEGAANVVVTDGFTGNLVLKTSEAVGKYLLGILKQEIMARPLAKVGAALAKPAFRAAGARLDDKEYGAGMLLGLNGLVTVGHGRAKRDGVYAALKATAQLVSADILQKTKARTEILMQIQKQEQGDPHE
jgi:glycerol-3-phosphate acyltransferase PlsX